MEVLPASTAAVLLLKAMLPHHLFKRAKAVLGSDSHSGRRWRAIGLSLATSMGDRVINGICSLLQVPLSLGFLGKEAFGLWMALTSLVNVMFIADFGLGIGAQNKMAAAYGRDDIAAAERTANTGFLMLALIGLVIFAICAPVCFLLDWGAIFHVQDPTIHRQTNRALLIIVAAFCLGLPLSVISRVVNAFQLTWMDNVKSSVNALTATLLILIAVQMKLGLLPFLAVAVCPPLITNIVQRVIIYRRFRWSLNPFATFDGEHGRTLLRENWLFVLPSIGGTIMSMGPPLLISSILGAAALTPYNLIQRLLGLGAQAQAMFVAPLQPAYTEAVARGDVGWARATYRKSLVFSFVFAVLPVLSFIIWGRWLLHLWSHQRVESFETILVAAMSAWIAVSNFSQPPAVLLNALGKIRGQASYGLFSVLIALALMPILIRHFGAAGAPLSLLVAFGVLGFPLVLWEASYQLRKMERQPSPVS